MKLKDFIVTVLVDIDAGVKEAEQKTGKTHVLHVYPVNGKHDDEGVQFDVAVTAGSEASGKIGAEVFSVGAKTEGKISNEEVSRIKFRVLPHHYSRFGHLLGQ
jgi:hypothetical protein